MEFDHYAVPFTLSGTLHNEKTDESREITS